MKIQLPLKKGQPNTNPDIEFDQLVIVGANGSGKTRFGSNIEERYNTKTHRISAQKSLSMPIYVSTKSREIAYSEFRFGGWNSGDPSWNQKYGWKSQRWNSNLNTSLLNDFDNLMVLLHTEEYEQSLLYKETGGAKPNTKLDKIQTIFEAVLPHRNILKKAGVIETYPTGNPTLAYNASEMSDGERVIFYLAGEVICSPQNAIIIIDEPEMHIHSSLIKIFFDLLEAERQDCCFIYLTHNIDFAFTRQNAKKIWAKSFENNIWDYEILDETIPIPEQLYLDVLGCRKPIIFLEGDNSSIDYELYGQVYDDKTLKPVGSCDKVVQVVKAFRDQIGFHHIESMGIIDRDRRQQADIIGLNRNGIWVLDVAEAENLLLIEPIVKAVANHMGKNAEEVFDQVRQNIINFFSNQIDNQILLHYKEILRREYLALSNFSSNNIANALIEIDAKFSGIDKQAIYNNIDINFKDILSRQDYDGILRVFNLKNSLIPNSQVCEMTGIRNKVEYKNATITLLKRKDQISSSLKSGIDSRMIKNAT
jgi:hypothetical protein